MHEHAMIAREFQDRVLAVSGGSQGFGRAISETFADHGARVFACDIVDSSSSDTRIVMDRVDLRDRAQGAEWIRSIEARVAGAIDILVCNAGGVAGKTHQQPLEAVDDADWDEVMALNLGSTLALCRASVPGMKRAGHGVIVTISSRAALQASWTGVQAYCSAKHAVLGLTRQLAHELGPFGIRVNSVAPGFFRTSVATERQWQAYGPERQAQIIDSVAMKRLGTTEEIAKAVLFFASDLASFVTGQVLPVDGGLR